MCKETSGSKLTPPPKKNLHAMYLCIHRQKISTRCWDIKVMISTPWRSSDVLVYFRVVKGFHIAYVCIFLCTVAPIITPITPINNGFRLSEGDPLMVRVDVMANPPIGGSFMWRRNGMKLPGRIIVTSNSISFNPVNREDTGTYVLSVSNSVGSQEISFVLNVTCK